MEHFGVKVREGKYGLEICRDKYAIISNKNSLHKFPSMEYAYADTEGKTYTDEWCKLHRENCLKNFDLNMKFYSSLNHEEFNEEIAKFLKTHKYFAEVSDLNKYDGISGYYIMILDKYCQIYIGTSNDIKKRIQQHWTKIQEFDRLIFPIDAVNTSVLTIDSFRALDTTRILACKTESIYECEDAYINAFSPKFITNRIQGGLPAKGLAGVLQVASTVKTRNLDI